MTGIFILALIFWGSCFPSETALAYQTADSLGYSIASVETLADGPVRWVTAGAGLLAYGEGKDLYLAPERQGRESLWPGTL